MSIIHFHYSSFENSGEIRRIKNINEHLVSQLSDSVIEVAFVSICYWLRKDIRFKLSPYVSRKLVFPVLPFSYSTVLGKHLNSIWTSLIIWCLCLIYKPSVIVGEYSVAGQSLRFVKNSIRCIVDVHGALREEYEYSMGNNADSGMSTCLDYYEKLGMAKASYIVCQSNEMKRYLLDKYTFLKDDNIFVYHCYADSSRFHINKADRSILRKEINVFGNETVFIYSGGLHRWQKVKESMELFHCYHNKYDTGHMIILTLDVATAQKVVNDDFSDLRDRITIRAVSHDQVPLYLNAADVAFLLRDNVVMNAVASPTKLAEYMSCGLPVITTSVGKCWLTHTGYIFNVDDKNIVDIDHFLKDIDRSNVSEYAHKEMSIEVDKEQLHKLIGSVKG